MTLLYSIPFEELQFAPISDPSTPHPYHTVIVGSGYGAAMAALALAMRENKDFENREILVIERGNEYVPGDFPKTLADLPGYVSTQGNNEPRTGYADALLDVRVGENVIAMVGSGLGGTSLINAGVAIDPDEEVMRLWPRPAKQGADWKSLLLPSLAFVRALLGVQKHPRGLSLAKVVALQSLSASLPSDTVTATHQLADIAVSFTDGSNNIGLDQRKCTDCGNCFTGCNIGAKNTLAMNAWPLAKSLGVTIVTGGTVERITRGSQDRYPWTVVACRTTDAAVTRPSRIHISCRRVILAAGTFGSTEILKRSATADANGDKLTVSGRLGSRFSLNGDGVAFGFGQRKCVNAYAKVPSAESIDPKPGETPGPTIVSMLSVRQAGAASPQRGLIEDATIPQPIARLWAETLSTQAMTRAYVPGEPSAWHQDHPDVDPLSVSCDLMAHHQPLLLMGVDDADGTLDFRSAWDHLGLRWPARLTDATRSGDRIERWQEKVLQRAAERGGFDGGLYLESPLWRPLPEAFDAVFEGASEMGGTHLCNHPLGGCAMANDASQGVVDSSGRVFSASSGQSVHEGLFVLDGSIIPGALGINPLMTIAGLAHYLAQQIDGAVAGFATVPRARNLPSVPKRVGQNVDWPVPPLAFTFRERLFGPTDPKEEPAVAAILGLTAQPNNYDKSKPCNTVVIDIEVQIPDVYRWLNNPSQKLTAVFSVYPNKNWARTIDTITNEDLGPPVVDRVRGEVQLFARDDKPPPTAWRGLLALWRFAKLRRDELIDVAHSKNPKAGNLLTRIEGFLRVAGQHAHWRYFKYWCSLPIGEDIVRISGTKRLAYDGSSSRKVRDDSNLWTTLANLRLSFTRDSSMRTAAAWFQVDVIHMVENLDALECVSHAETPHVVAAASSVAALAARAFVQTHFWSFGAPSYEEFPTSEGARTEIRDI